MKTECEYVKMSNFLFWLVGKEWNRGKYVTATDKDSLIRGMQKYSEHLRKKFRWKDDSRNSNHLSDEVNKQLETIAFGINKAADRRNHACHGGKKVSRKEAIEDKQWVLTKKWGWQKKARIDKKLILEILSLYDLEWFCCGSRFALLQNYVMVCVCYTIDIRWNERQIWYTILIMTFKLQKRMSLILLYLRHLRMSLKDENTRNGVPIIDLLYIYDFRKDRLRKLPVFSLFYFWKFFHIKDGEGTLQKDTGDS